MYESIRVKEKSKIEETIKKIWKSVFTPNAISERSKFQIEHTDVGIGIIIQPFISNIKSRGVLITKADFYQ
jgi:phosphoenolpyruvate synthase/pyruvate phosphate dikinase